MQAPLDGVELINPDTSWRVHAFTDDGSRWLLLRTLLGYAVRPSEAVAGVLTGSDQLRAQWLALTADRPVVAIAGADAHAKLALRDCVQAVVLAYEAGLVVPGDAGGDRGLSAI